MKRLVVEVPYGRFWAGFFGRYADRVKVIEGLKCFKCDSEGFALICKVKLLDDNLEPMDFIKAGPVETVETLYEEKDGSRVIFMSGHYPGGSEGRRSAEKNVFEAEAPEFTDVNTMKITLVGDEKDLQTFLRQAEGRNLALKVLSLTRLGPKADSPLSVLTGKQRKVLVTAYSMGYYDLPRKISSNEMARLLKIDRSTLAEHLRKAERRMIRNVMAG